MIGRPSDREASSQLLPRLLSLPITRLPGHWAFRLLGLPVWPSSRCESLKPKPQSYPQEENISGPLPTALLQPCSYLDMFLLFCLVPLPDPIPPLDSAPAAHCQNHDASGCARCNSLNQSLGITG